MHRNRTHTSLHCSATAAVAIMLAIAFAASPADAGRHKPPVTSGESVTLACEAGALKEVAGLGAAAAAVGIESVKDVAKVVAKIGAWGLRRYAKDFEASYSAKTIEDDALNMGVLQSYGCEFVRKVEGKEALRFEFNLLASQEMRGYRVDPKKLIYDGSKAKKANLPLTNADDLKLALVFQTRSPFAGANGPATATSEAVSMSVAISATSTEDIVAKLSPFGTDWLPAPTSSAFSLEVTALESSDFKKWIEKAADGLDDFAKD